MSIPLDPTWIATAQVYATLSAGWRCYEAEHAARGVTGMKTAKVHADAYQDKAIAALVVAGVRP